MVLSVPWSLALCITEMLKLVSQWNRRSAPHVRHMLSLFRRLESDPRRVETALTLLFASLFAAMVIRWWIPGIFSSYWLDETGSLWVTQGGANQMFYRSTRCPQSLAYCVLLWITSLVAGSGPVVFHLLSVVASLFTAFALFRLGRRYLPVSGAVLAVGLWAITGANYTLVTQARPYAFAMAASVACAWQLERWLDNSSWPNTVLLGVAGILPSYFFFPNIVLLGSIVLYVLIRRAAMPPVSRILGVAACWVLLSVIPVAEYLSVSNFSAHAISTRPGDRLELFWIIVPLPFVVAYVVAMIVSKFLPFGDAAKGEDGRGALILALTFAVLLPTAFFVASKMGQGLWHIRHLSAVTPFVALLQASVLTALRPLAVRIVALAVLVTFAVPGPASEIFRGPLIPDRGGRAYGSAIAEVRQELQQPGTVLIGTSEFVQGRRWKFPVSDVDKDWLMAPITTQIPGVTPILLPVQLEQGDEAYRAAIVTTLQQVDRAVYFGGPLPAWMAGVYKEGEWTKEVRLANPAWELVTFTRSHPNSGSRLAR